jgi:hypothetical protein
MKASSASNLLSDVGAQELEAVEGGTPMVDYAVYMMVVLSTVRSIVKTVETVIRTVT